MTDYRQATLTQSTTLTKTATIASMIRALGISMNSIAADLPTRHILTLDAARTAVAAAEAEARQKGWPCVVAVTDDEGLPRWPRSHDGG
jgi:hypothetical protein